MTAGSDIWMAFARTFGMLFMVLALLLLGFYLVRRFSGIKGMKNSRELIQVLAIHHLSPKEKLVLVKVLEEIILMGVTPASISKIAVLDKNTDLSGVLPKDSAGFSQILAKTLNRGIFRPDSGKKQNTPPTRDRHDV
ncbi:MAG TPA: flagellar biosynthetic protein FliO [Desulfotignum sp.]|nr:flagellar biosynthetic protein FliO [Desulfotignum sp.]